MRLNFLDLVLNLSPRLLRSAEIRYHESSDGRGAPCFEDDGEGEDADGGSSCGSGAADTEPDADEWSGLDYTQSEDDDDVGAPDGDTDSSGASDEDTDAR